MLNNVVMNQGAGIPIFQEYEKRIFELEVGMETEKRKNAKEFS